MYSIRTCPLNCTIFERNAAKYMLTFLPLGICCVTFSVSFFLFIKFIILGKGKIASFSEVITLSD